MVHLNHFVFAPTLSTEIRDYYLHRLQIDKFLYAVAVNGTWIARTNAYDEV